MKVFKGTFDSSVLISYKSQELIWIKMPTLNFGQSILGSHSLDQTTNLRNLVFTNVSQLKKKTNFLLVQKDFCWKNQNNYVLRNISEKNWWKHDEFDVMSSLKY